MYITRTQISLSTMTCIGENITVKAIPLYIRKN